MGKLIKFEIIEIPETLLIGKEIRYSEAELMKGNNPLPEFWGKCFEEGIFTLLESQADYIQDPAYAGVMLDWDKGDDNLSYIVGMMMKPGAEVPHGYFSRKLGSTKVAVGWIQGKDTQDICGAAHQMTQAALKESGNSCEKMTWCMELYTCPRFTTPDEDGNITLDYYIPID